MIEQTREEYRRAFFAWVVACRIRRALRGVGPVKKWYDECRVILARAERAHRRALWELECNPQLAIYVEAAKALGMNQEIRQ